MKRVPWLILLAACSDPQRLGDGVPVREAYGGAPDLRITMSGDPSPMAARRPIPVYYPPQIFAVYVPSQISRKREVMIGEHWIFFKLKEGGWLPEREEEEPSTQEKASPEEVELVRRYLGGVRFVVPHE